MFGGYASYLCESRVKFSGQVPATWARAIALELLKWLLRVLIRPVSTCQLTKTRHNSQENLDLIFHCFSKLRSFQWITLISNINKSSPTPIRPFLFIIITWPVVLLILSLNTLYTCVVVTHAPKVMKYKLLWNFQMSYYRWDSLITYISTLSNKQTKLEEIRNILGICKIL